MARITEIKKIYINTDCIRNPFYIRFINQLGGYDYFMFEKSQKYEAKGETGQLIEKTVSDLRIATGNLKKINTDLTNKVTVGKANLDNSTLEALQNHLLPALVIQWYNETTTQWVDIYIESQTIIYDTDKNAGNIEISFMLNKRYTVTN